MQLDLSFNVNPEKKNVIFIDANNMLKRCYHAAMPKDGNGEIIQSRMSSPYSFMLNTAYAIRREDYFFKNHFGFAVMDSPTSKNSRLEIYPEYKATRESRTDEEKEIQNEMFKVFEILGYPVIEIDNIEADDVIGALGIRSAALGHNVIVVTSDKDYFQMLEYSPYINIYRQQSKDVVNQNNFNLKFDFDVKYFVDYLSLIGDNVDNINGIEGLKDKRATLLINEFGGINEIIANVNEDTKVKGVPDKVMASLKNAIENKHLELNKKLIQFQYDAKFDIPDNKKRMKPIDYNALYDYCKKHNLNEFYQKNISYLYNSRQPEYSHLKPFNDEQSQKKSSGYKIK